MFFTWNYDIWVDECASCENKESVIWEYYVRKKLEEKSIWFHWNFFSQKSWKDYLLKLCY